MREFDHAGVFFFDPRDPATVDAAWRRLRATAEPPIATSRLDELYSWDLVARTLLDAYERDRIILAAPVIAAPARVRRSDRMRIGIEVFGTQTGSRLRGIGRYSRELVAAMLARDPESDFVLYAQEGLPTDRIPTAPNADVRLLRPKPDAGVPTLAHAMDRLVENNPDRLDALLLLNTLELSPGYDIPARPLNGPKVASVVLDLIPVLFPGEYHHRWNLPGLARRYGQALDRLRNHDVLLAISESTRRDLLARLDLAPDRVVTVGAASDGRFFEPDRSEPMPEESRALLSALGIVRPFVFSVGAADHRKNPRGLIDAFAMLPDRLRQAHQLVLTYGLTGPDRGLVRQHARDRGVEDALVLTDRISDRALRVLYQRCAAFVFPSLYEGFGLPVLEAMECGAAVIAGNNSAQIEVVGDAGVLVNAGDPEDLAADLAAVLEDPDWARDLGELAAIRAGRFRWEQTAGRVLEASGGRTPPGRQSGRGPSKRDILGVRSPSSRPCRRWRAGSRTNRSGCWRSSAAGTRSTCITTPATCRISASGRPNSAATTTDCSSGTLGCGRTMPSSTRWATRRTTASWWRRCCGIRGSWPGTTSTRRIPGSTVGSSSGPSLRSSPRRVAPIRHVGPRPTRRSSNGPPRSRRRGSSTSLPRWKDSRPHREAGRPSPGNGRDPRYVR